MIRTIIILLFTIIFVYSVASCSRKDEPVVSDVGQMEKVDRNESTRKNPELAPYMGELQRLTHKLSLSIANANYDAADFYLYESLSSLKDIQDKFPEYESWPVALLVDRFNTPIYEELQKVLKTGRAAGSVDRPMAVFAKLIRSCNDCHAATQHAFIKITIHSSVNPFNQDFRP